MSHHKNHKLDNMKYEIADELGIELKDGYNGELTSHDAGRIGGQLVKRMVKFAEMYMPDDFR